MEPDELPGGYKVGAGQDVMISVYNIHHSPQVWDNAEEFQPERFNLDDPVPNESNTDFKYEKYPSPDLFSRYRPFFFFFSTNLKSVSYLILNVSETGI